MMTFMLTPACLRAVISAKLVTSSSGRYKALTLATLSLESQGGDVDAAEGHRSVEVGVLQSGMLTGELEPAGRGL